MERIVYLKQENKRAAGARNHAIGQARGEFVAFLDSDDTWMPEHLSTQMQMFADDPTLDLVYANGLLVGDPVHEYEFMEKSPSNGPATFEALIMGRCSVSISTVVARKRILVEAGLFDETLRQSDDYDMWVRSAFKGARIGYSRQLGARFFIGRPGSLSQSKAKMTEGYWKILEKYKRTLPLNDADREMVEKRADDIRAKYLLEEGKSKLEERQFDEGRQLIAEANGHLQWPSLSAAVLGLRFAPGTTMKLMEFWRWIKRRASV
jgi:glycosyltransferase involved in cell wall biosynthesis